MSFFIYKNMSCVHGKNKENFNLLADYEPVPSTSSATFAQFYRKDKKFQDVVFLVYDHRPESPKTPSKNAKPQPGKKNILTRIYKHICRFRRGPSKSL